MTAVQTHGHHRITLGRSNRHPSDAGNDGARSVDYGRYFVREAIWVFASLLTAVAMLFGNAGSWSTNHGLAGPAAAMTLRAEAALAGLVYAGGCSIRALAWSLRRN